MLFRILSRCHPKPGLARSPELLPLAERLQAKRGKAKRARDREGSAKARHRLAARRTFTRIIEKGHPAKKPAWGAVRS